MKRVSKRERKRDRDSERDALYRFLCLILLRWLYLFIERYVIPLVNGGDCP